MRKLLSNLCLLAVLCVGCNIDDGQNQAPGAFDLLGVVDQETGVDLKPTLTWDAAIDPDGDSVTYDIYLDTNAQPTQKLVDGVGSTEFTIVDKLSLNTQYYWRVVAKDGQGNVTQSQVFSFTTRDFLRAVQIGAIPSQVTGHAATVFDHKIVVTGGYNGALHWPFVFSSSDGTDWNAEVRSSLGSRAGHTLNSMGTHIMAVGGFADDPGYRSDVVISEDGLDWDEVIKEEFEPRLGHTMTFYQGTWVLIGGRSAISYHNAFTAEEDLIDNWQLSPLDDKISKRVEHTAVEFDGMIWIIGGRTSANTVTNEIFKISRSHLEEVPVNDIPFPARQGHTSLVYDNKLWLIGGIDESGNALNDIWHCGKDGEWKQMMLSEDFGARGNHASVVFDDKIFIIGGNDGNDVKSDVWILE